MEDGKDYEERKSVVIEGMYRGMTGKIEEVRRSVSKELQFSSAQQVSAYEALSNSFKESVQSLFAELKYLSQQNSAIYDYGRKERESESAALQKAFAARAQELADGFFVKTQSLAESFFAKTEALAQDLNAKADALAEEFDAKVKALAEVVSAKSEEAARASREQLEKAARDLDEAWNERFEALRAELQTAAPAEERGEETALAEASVDEAAPVAAAAPAGPDDLYAEDTFDYDVLAEKIASVLPEVDYDALVDRVTAAIPPVDENALADRVAEAVPPVDYDLFAERVASLLEHEFDVTVDEAGIARIAEAVAEQFDYDRLAEAVAEKIGSRVQPVAIAAAATAVAAAAEAPAEPEAAQSAPVHRELAAAAAPQPAAVPAPVIVPLAGDADVFTRLKRSFRAKIIESDDEVKGYYFDLKNAFLAYGKVNSQISWTNDRYSYQGETVAKVGVRGRTLCLYLALNPDEYPSSVYHQKFAGDTKMYEKTPMMVKIKSKVALKRALRLVEMLMETLGAVKEDRPPEDFSREFAYRSEEQLLAEGLIKTALVEKTDLDF